MNTFDLIPVISNVPVKIESIDIWGNNIYIGTNDGQVLLYIIEKVELNKKVTFKSRMEKKRSLGHGKKPVEKILLISDIGKLLTLCAGPRNGALGRAATIDGVSATVPLVGRAQQGCRGARPVVASHASRADRSGDSGRQRAQRGSWRGKRLYSDGDRVGRVVSAYRQRRLARARADIAWRA
ncbi:hypothetical protein DFA_03273 [Cavenderia fasciculata]|uniref:CNH domain-containing protein n=1 Tax=Cavenderia fasciculata TaxID=261658 RepID=F4PH43_CACFS|nr:uncharacterized protein DFA_03273 [Cavenderia fasciculata]EGG25027.1 hypothetical protein DFA_03273 [Cavenderia fasciculata]|eukprot:XP_004362878.1 hypothetical protein DFA_03273 [Cavenderia fasciculata]